MSLREGSAHEEEALVEALREVVTTVDSLQDDTRTLLPVLVQFGYGREAGALQGGLVALLEAVRAELGRIWPPDGGEGQAMGPAEAQVMCVW